MGGKNSTSTSTVTVPQDVLNRYNAVNAQAQATAATPFQQYSGQFVAPVNPQQTAAIGSINANAQLAQPYYNTGSMDITGALNAAQPYFAGASTDVTGAQSIGNQLGGASLSSLLGAGSAAAPWQTAAGSNYGSAYAGAQPYQIAATELGLAGGQSVNPYQITPQAIDQFLSPYLQQVLGSTANVLNQNNQQQQAGQLGDAIRSGAFGGDRAGITAANLEQQQNLANAQIYSGIENTGFNNALQAAQQQQGVYLGAGQANRAALQEAAGQLAGIGQQGYQQGMGLGSAQQGLGAQLYSQGANTAAQEAALGQQQFGQGITAAQTQSGLGQAVFGTGLAAGQGLANIGTQAQQSALAGAQAQLGAGTLQQQTQQAQDTALYNQFLQQQAYPFQVDQFLANIAEGTGALSGSTTTTTTPGGLFSDERLKEDIQPIGKTFDGQNIVQFRYKGDPTRRIGLVAQEVEKKHPEAVGQSQGFKTVDYGKATDPSAEKGHFRSGGLVPSNDNGIMPRKQLAYGGYPSLPGMWPADIGAILAAQANMYAPYGANGAGAYGSQSGSLPRGGGSYVPQASLPVSHLAVANSPPPQPNRLEQMNNISSLAKNLADPNLDKGFGEAMAWLKGLGGSNSNGLVNGDPTQGLDNLQPVQNPNYVNATANARGGLVPRRSYDDGGMADLPYDPSQDQSSPYGPRLNIPNDNPKAQLAVAKAPGAPPSPLSQIAQIGSTAAGLGDMAKIAGQGISGLQGLIPATTAGLGVGAGGLGAAAAGGADALGALAAGTAGGGIAAGASVPLAALLPFLALAKGGSVRKGYDDGGSPTDDQDDPMSNLLLSGLGNIVPNIANAVIPGLGAISALGGDTARAAPVSNSKTAPPSKQTPEQNAEDVSALANLATTGSAGLAGPAYGLSQGQRALTPSLGDVAQAATLPKAAPRGIAPRSTGLAPPANTNVPPPVAGPSSSGVSVPADTASIQNMMLNGIAPQGGDPAGLSNAYSIPADANVPQLTPPNAQPRPGLGGGIAPVTGPVSGAPQVTGIQAPQSGGTGLGGALSGIGQGIEGALGKAGNWAQHNPAALMSILAGIGAAGAAQTKYPLIALTQGLGTAGQTYGNIKGQLAGAAQQQAQAQVGQTAAWSALHPAPFPGAQWVPGTDPVTGRGELGPDGKTMGHWVSGGFYQGRPTGSGVPVPGQGAPRQPAQNYHYLGQAGLALAPNEGVRYSMSAPQMQNDSNKMRTQIAQQADQARTNITQENLFGSSMAANDQGMLTPGENQGWRLHLANSWNDAARAAGVPQLQIDASGATDAALAQKMSIQMAGMREAGLNMSAFQGLEAMMHATANGSMPRDAALKIISKDYATSQRSIDLDSYATELDQEQQRTGIAQPNAYLMQDALNAFGQDHSALQYEHEGDAMFKIMRDPVAWPALQRQLQSGDPKQIAAAQQALDQAVGPNFHRLFSGGQ